MRVSTSITLGKFNTYKIETEGNTLFDCIYKMGGVHSVSKCGLCESDYLYLRATKTTEGDFEYLKVSCGKCQASVTFGKTKKDGIMYYRRKDGKLDWEKYSNEKSAEGKAEKTAPSVKEPENGSDLPF